jgi:hypothetical protein
MAHHFEKLQLNFLWGGLGDGVKFQLVSWKTICEPIQSGGLGIKNFVRINIPLLGKWIWHFATETETLWRLVAATKYGSALGNWASRVMTSRVTNGPHVVSLWKHIRNGWQRFSKFLKYEVGSGSHTHFWLDLWCGEVTLKEAFCFCFV